MWSLFHRGDSCSRSTLDSLHAISDQVLSAGTCRRWVFDNQNISVLFGFSGASMLVLMILLFDQCLWTCCCYCTYCWHLNWYSCPGPGPHIDSLYSCCYRLGVRKKWPTVHLMSSCVGWVRKREKWMSYKCQSCVGREEVLQLSQMGLSWAQGTLIEIEMVREGRSTSHSSHGQLQMRQVELQKVLFIVDARSRQTLAPYSCDCAHPFLYFFFIGGA